MTHRAGAVLLAAFLLVTAGCGTAGSTASVNRCEPPGTTATARAVAACRETVMTTASPPGAPAGLPPEGSPSGVAAAAGGQWAVASLGTALGVLRLSVGRPADLVHGIELPTAAAGAALTPGQFPRDVAVAPGSSTLLVANYDSGQLETVNLTALP